VVEISLCLCHQLNISHQNPTIQNVRSHVITLPTNVAPLYLRKVDTCVITVDECTPGFDIVSINAENDAQYSSSTIFISDNVHISDNPLLLPHDCTPVMLDVNDDDVYTLLDDVAPSGLRDDIHINL
jgi:spore coat protein CotH